LRVLIASQYFPPEITAGANRVHSFAAGLTERGHQVEVVCELPSHPAGVVAPGYGGLADRRELDGFGVSYVWVRARPSKAKRARLANYASYAASAAIEGSRREKPDVILASSPPLSVGSVGSMLAVRHRAPWVLDVRDLWPDVALELGEVGEGALLRFAERLERRLYRSAAAITATTEHFKSVIEDRGGAGKVEVLRNGAGPQFMAAGLEEPDRALTGNAGDRFVWGYAGNLGIAQGLEAAVEAARQLGDGYRLLLLGEGARRAELEEAARAAPEGAIEFRDPVPPEQAARVLRACDALLVPLAANPGLEGFVPSKLFDCAAVGRPLIVAVAGEGGDIAEAADAAVRVPPGDPEALASAVRELATDAARRERLAAAARAFGEVNSRERGVERLEAALEAVVGGDGQRG
jgi:glycosyltransferase involved in cell wall biosynthesis